MQYYKLSYKTYKDKSRCPYCDIRLEIEKGIVSIHDIKAKEIMFFCHNCHTITTIFYDDDDFKIS